MAEHDSAPRGVIDGGVHVYPVRVYYDDTDAAGIVYYANYLRMAERARTEMLRMIGVQHTGLAHADGVSIAVSRCEVDYLRPARLDDELRIRTRITALGGATMWAEQIVRRAGADLARLTVRLACIGPTGRAARFPRALRAALEKFRAADQSLARERA
jgi:acyl-CoA thioester hydrolase